MTSADKLLFILRLFSAEQPLWTVEQAAPVLNVSLSTAYRYFRSLVKAGLLDPVGGSGRYALGPAIIELDRNIRLSDPVLRAALPTMQWLVAQIDRAGSLLLCRLYQDKVMCIHQQHATDGPHRISYERGLPLPMFRGAASKAILAHLPPRHLRRLYDAHPAQIAEAGLGASWDEFKDRLRTIRRNGLCISRGELTPGTTGLSVPLFSPQRQVLGSLSIAHRGAMDEPSAARIGALLIAAGREIDAVIVAALGGTATSQGSASSSDPAHASGRI
ncbi:MAG TPA: IclR family transcriptional regulator [Alphaproteobacteria bacterium]